MEPLIENLNYIISFLALIVLFFLAVPPRFSPRVSWVVIGIFSALMCAGFIAATVSYPDIAIGTFSLLFFTIPSFVMCLCMAKYRGFRFVFTFCSIDIFGMISVLFSILISIACGGVAWLGLVCNLVFYATLFLTTMKCRGFYRKQLSDSKGSWASLALVSIIFYLLFYTMTAYPKPLIQRLEYVPVLLFYCCSVIAVYVVLFQTIERMQKIQQSEQTEELLKTQLSLQKSQLELQQLYYKLAYLDNLTGLKNRTAFEERREALSTDLAANLPLCCASFDINNLKQANDTLGHEFGDQLIRRAAGLLREAIGSDGEVYRTGGDEFVALIAHASYEWIEKGRQKLYALMEQDNAHNALQLSLADGWEIMEDMQTDTLQQTALRADRSMYERKRKMKAVQD